VERARFDGREPARESLDALRRKGRSRSRQRLSEVRRRLGLRQPFEPLRERSRRGLELPRRQPSRLREVAQRTARAHALRRRGRALPTRRRGPLRDRATHVRDRPRNRRAWRLAPRGECGRVRPDRSEPPAVAGGRAILQRPAERKRDPPAAAGGTDLPLPRVGRIQLRTAIFFGPSGKAVRNDLELPSDGSGASGREKVGGSPFMPFTASSGSSHLELWKNTLTEHPQTSFGSRWCRYAT
jgi:hypothetical protein